MEDSDAETLVMGEEMQTSGLSIGPVSAAQVGQAAAVGAPQNVHRNIMRLFRKGIGKTEPLVYWIVLPL